MPEGLRTARPRAQLRQGRTDWYRITNSAGDGPATVHVYDEIGYWGVTAQDFISELKAISASEISLHINSPGGEIFDGIAIMNALRHHPATVTTYVDSLAASIASVIAMAGDRVVMAPHSQMMIHDGSGLQVGNAAAMREMAELLDRQSDNIAGIYAEKAGGTVAEWRARMTAETWYTAAEAVDAGLADEISSTRTSPNDNSPKNSWDLSVFTYAGRDKAPDPDVPRLANEAPAVEEAAAPETREDETPAESATPDAGSDDAEAEGEEDEEPPVPVHVELTDWDPAVFRAAMARASGELTDWDPELFRNAVRVSAEDAPAVAVRVPEPVAVEPGWARPAEPAPEPERNTLAEIFRAALTLVANDAPAPTAPPPAAEPDPQPFDPTVVTRALREEVRR